jgi:hypothetical protein
MAKAANCRWLSTIVMLSLGVAIAPISGRASDALAWQVSYAGAVREAQDRQVMALFWFYDPAERDKNERFELEQLGADEIQPLLANYVIAKLPLDTKYQLPSSESARGDEVAAELTLETEGQSEGRSEQGELVSVHHVRLIDHPAFAELGGEPGLVILDLSDESSPHFRRVVSVYPLGTRSLSAQQLVALLELPPGTLTQRTLIWAVWTHPERPESANGTPHEVLEEEAESHSRHQAATGVQGHHRWGSRFQRLLGRLPSGLVAQEVCAESWPGQRLVDAAEECVRSWRHSSGHWDAVRRTHPVFGYDMKRGANGIWYATGVFGRRQ